jgi:Tfp pilus assembly PilM family ATPase
MKSVFLEKSLGLDIREDSISLTLIGRKLRLAEVLAGEFIDLKLLTGKDEKAEKHFLDQVNRFLVEQNTWPESVIVSLPRSLVMFKTFELPAPDMKAVQAMVEFELERHFPSGLDDLYYTYQLNQKSGNIFHIASAAIKKETANYYLELIKKLNLKPTVLDISTFANSNLALQQEPKDSAVTALIDISPSALEIVLVKKGVLEFSRNRTWENTDIKDAYSGKGKSPDRLDRLSESTTKIIISELEQALSSCRNIEENESIEHIFISGGGTLAPRIIKQLEKETQVSTQFISIPDSVSPALPESFSTHHMMTALSLAIRDSRKTNFDTNLLPQNLRPKRRTANPKTSLALAAVLILFLAGWIGNQIHYNNKTLASLNGQLGEIKGEVSNLEKIDLEYISIQQYVEILNAINKQHPPKLPLLGRLSQSLPKDTWLTNIKFHKGEMEIKGFSPSASKLVPLIEKSTSFKKTGFVGTIIRESTGEKFTIRAKLESSS